VVTSDVFENFSTSGLGNGSSCIAKSQVRPILSVNKVWYVSHDTLYALISNITVFYHDWCLVPTSDRRTELGTESNSECVN
jgi:hypothetical protein